MGPSLFGVTTQQTVTYYRLSGQDPIVLRLLVRNMAVHPMQYCVCDLDFLRCRSDCSGQWVAIEEKLCTSSYIIQGFGHRPCCAPHSSCL